MAGYVDAHNHLQDARLAGCRLALIEVCEQIGVTRCVVNGTSPKDWSEVSELAARYGWIVPSFGVHPWYVKDLSQDWFELLSNKMHAHGEAVIGEIGIDHWKEGTDRELQEAVFLKQLRLAVELNRPVTLHGLKAWGRLLELLRRHGAPKRGFLLHSYSGPEELVRPFADLGAYFSCAPAFLSPSRTKKLETFKVVPIEKLLAETDAPDQNPPAALERYHLRDAEGEPLNHPGNIAIVYTGLASLLGLDEKDLRERLSLNFDRLFSRQGA